MSYHEYIIHIFVLLQLDVGFAHGMCSLYLQEVKIQSKQWEASSCLHFPSVHALRWCIEI
jgi:hypothetical protein